MGKSKKLQSNESGHIKKVYKTSRKTLSQVLRELPKLEDLEEFEFEDLKTIIKDCE